jgi:hypothetical protein
MHRLAGTGVWIASGIWVATAAAGLSLTIATWSVDAQPFADAAIGNARDVALGAVFAVVGLVLAAKRPGNAVGWLLVGVALSLSLNVLFTRYAIYGLLAHPGSLPGAAVAAALGSSAWVILISSLALLLLMFPDGRLPSRRWRVVVWTLLVVDVSTWIGNTLVPGPLTRPLNAYDNPIGIGALRSVNRALSLPGWLIIVIFAAGAVSLVQRFRRAQGDERQQYKWFTFAAVLFPVADLVTQVIDSVAGQATTADTVASSITGIVATVIPVATAVAVLRYRLYEIDRLISRTITYLLVTGVLVGVFAGIVLLATRVLPFSSPVGVAASTLAAAALFNPLRRRVQGLVDRRFNRTRYDAETVIAAFGGRLRGAVDLESVQAGLLAAVSQTTSPAHASIWLRNDPETVTR